MGFGRCIGPVVAVLALCPVWIQAATAGVITEVLTQPTSLVAGSITPVYIEVTRENDVGPMDLAIVDARPNRQFTILSIIRLPASGDSHYVIHEGTWAGPTFPATTYIPVSTLPLAHSRFGLSRAIVLYDHATDLQPFPNSLRDAALNEGGIADAVTVRFGNASVLAFDDSPILSIQMGDGISRRRDSGQWTTRFGTGPVGPDATLATGDTLNPGVLNFDSATTLIGDHPISVPEPAAVMLILAGIIGRPRQ